MTYKFTVKKEGYDKQQVKDVIMKLDLENKNLVKENNILHEKIDELADKFDAFIKKYYELEKKGKKQKASSSEIAKQAVEEANALIEEAKKNADIIINDALKKVNIITDDALKLKMEVSAFKENVRHLASNVMEYIDKSSVLMDSTTKNLLSGPTKAKNNIKKIKTIIEE